MPPSPLALRRAFRLTLAVSGAVAPSAAASPPAPQAGGASLAAPAAGGATTAGSADSSAGVKLVASRLTLSTTRTIAVTVRASGHAVRVRVRVGSQGRKVAEVQLSAGQTATLRGGALRGETLHVLARRADGSGRTQDVTVGQVRGRQQLRLVTASWYGPGLYGNRTACGQTLTRGLRGVAHKSLPCGTAVTVRFRGRTTQARVVDRGPFHAGREFDLTFATANAIGFRQVGRVSVSA